MRPRFTVLSDSEVDKIIDSALTVLERIGMHIGSPGVMNTVGSHDGGTPKGDRLIINRDLVEKCLKEAPSEIRVYPQDSLEALMIADDQVNYVAGSVAMYLYDEKKRGLREPCSKDLIEHIKVLNQCNYIDFQSGSYVVNDVPKPITSSYRYYLSLLYSPKPTFGGAFGTQDIVAIRDMLAVIAGGEKELERSANAVICLNPSSPLSLTEIAAENLVFCAKHNLPVMLVPIPLAGGSSPVTGLDLKSPAKDGDSFRASQLPLRLEKTLGASLVT